jgi:hypothetical protein
MTNTMKPLILAVALIAVVAATSAPAEAGYTCSWVGDFWVCN